MCVCASLQSPGEPQSNVVCVCVCVRTCKYLRLCTRNRTLAPGCSAVRDQAGRGGTSRELASPSSRSPRLYLGEVY